MANFQDSPKSFSGAAMIPCTLREWRELEVGPPARTAWQQFEPFFEEHGYKLFVIDPSLGIYANMFLVPPAGCSPVRSEDEYGRFLPDSLQMKPQQTRFRPATGLHVAARSSKNTDVVIRILAIGNEGQEHLDIMRALAAPDAQVPENHTVPMLEELQKDNIVFGVFPYMWDEGMCRPWFRTVRELLDALEQAMEGFVYLHRRLIAHRDFSLHEVFMNYGRDWDFERMPNSCHRLPRTFRSICPDVRYFINDLELSVQFAPDSDPKTRLVTGIPFERYGYTAEIYSKPLAPEALSDAPYCPFKADIFQFGRSATYFYRNVDTVPGLQELFIAMGSDDPDARPTAAQALATLRVIRQATPEEELNNVPTDKHRWYQRLLPGEKCNCSFCMAGSRKILAYDLNLQSLLSQAILTACK